MPKKFAQSFYEIQNPHKYVGNKKPFARSSWETTFMMFCDNNEHILQWASEPLQIPYRHPLTGKGTVYVPDFLITYRDRADAVRGELIEIKPLKQSVFEGKMKTHEQATVAINYAKWNQATKWARQNGLLFRVINENDIYHMGGTKR